MYNKRFSEFVIKEKADIFKAYWEFCKYEIPFIVLNEENKFVGIIGKEDFKKAILGGGRY